MVIKLCSPDRQLHLYKLKIVDISIGCSNPQQLILLTFQLDAPILTMRRIGPSNCNVRKINLSRSSCLLINTRHVYVHEGYSSLFVCVSVCLLVTTLVPVYDVCATDWTYQWGLYCTPKVSTDGFAKKVSFSSYSSFFCFSKARWSAIYDLSTVH